MKTKLVLVMLLTGPAVLAQPSVWLPAPGHVVVTPVFASQSFRDIWMGSHPMRLDDTVSQRTAMASFEVGLTQRLAVDAALGYSHVKSSAFGGPASDSGMTDSQFGLRWRFHRAFALRAGGIVKGTYTPAFPFSAGDGGSGAELSLLAGHSFGESGFSLYGDAGYRVRNRRVPADTFASAGLVRSFRAVSLSGGYRHARGLRGADIGDPGFTFPQLREVHHTLEAALGFRNHRGQGYQFFMARTFSGRNTGRKTVIGMAFTFDFKTPWRR